MLGGPLMNLLIGVVLLTVLVTVHGVATAQPGAVVASVSQCVVPVTEAADATDVHRPAEDPARSRPGCSRATASSRSPASRSTTPGTSARLIRPRLDEPVTIVLERDGKQLTVTATPIRNVVPVLDADGLPSRTPTAPPDHRGRLPRRPVAPPVAYVPQPVTAVPGHAVELRERQPAGAGPRPRADGGRVAGGVRRAEREADSPMSVVGVGRVAGEASAGKYDSSSASRPPTRSGSSSASSPR